jgi:DNA polymerase-3 subunit alpha
VLDDISDIEQDGFIFDVLTPKASYEEKEELPDHVLSEYEKEYLGFYAILFNIRDIIQHLIYSI